MEWKGTGDKLKFLSLTSTIVGVGGCLANEYMTTKLGHRSRLNLDLRSSSPHPPRTISTMMIKSNTFDKTDESVEVAASNLAPDDAKNREQGGLDINFDDDVPLDAKASPSKMSSFCSSRGCALFGGVLVGTAIGFVSGGASAANKAALIQMQAATPPGARRRKSPTQSKAPKPPSPDCDSMVGMWFNDTKANGFSWNLTSATEPELTMGGVLPDGSCTYKVEMVYDTVYTIELAGILLKEGDLNFFGYFNDGSYGYARYYVCGTLNRKGQYVVAKQGNDNIFVDYKSRDATRDIEWETAPLVYTD